MKKILLTGGTGFIGRNILPLLQLKYNVFAPRRYELDLKDTEAVKKFLTSNHIDIVIHTAIPNAISNENDLKENLCEDSLVAFLNLYNCQNEYNKMIYFGSGAEFDKSRDIIQAKESDFSSFIPKSSYGLAKYTMNLLAQQSKNIYNLRIFGCFGPTDAEFKFITHAIRCCMKQKSITINQDCYFDYIYVLDLYHALEIAIESNLKFHDYNICSGNRYQLSEIAQMINRKFQTHQKIVKITDGFNHEYTGSNARFLSEFHNFKFMNLTDALDLQIESERRMFNEKKSS